MPDSTPPLNKDGKDSPQLLALKEELATLDREWALKKDRFWSSRSSSRLPTLGGGLERAVRAIISGLAFALFTGFLARGATLAGASPIFWVLPAFGTIVMLYGIASLLSIAPKARKFQQSEVSYNTKRADLEARIRAIG